ncbi:hypothetical protein FH972_010213 [Carpinus fangiana]|uniref:Uncharacterized protein n=1 Tax=Carpinus fangiana TaxID=176857 RepID=A0A660KPJ8_9ROSI|nr:hypothetical protein FH972_010213 [Carpinus fangiana]
MREKLALQPMVALGVAGVRQGSRISFGGASCIQWVALSSSGGGVDESNWLLAAAVVAGGEGFGGRGKNGGR